MSRNIREEERRLFAQFLSMTNTDKEQYFGFSTQKEFGEKFNVAEKTLTQWRNHDPRFKKMKSDMQRQLASDYLPDVINALRIRAVEDMDVSAAREYLKYLGESIDKTEIGLTGNDAQGLLLTVGEIIQRHVTDEVTLAAIAKELSEIAEEL
jgi:hypothetical protein